MGPGAGGRGTRASRQIETMVGGEHMTAGSAVDPCSTCPQLARMVQRAGGA